MSKKPAPQDHAEAIAIFRAQVLGPLLCREHQRGQLDKILLELSTIAVRPPGSDVTRTYAVPTLRRWYYRYRQHGLEGLRPVSRKRGYARALSGDLRDLNCDIRRARPNASGTWLQSLFILLISGARPLLPCTTQSLFTSAFS